MMIFLKKKFNKKAGSTFGEYGLFTSMPNNYKAKSI